MNIPELLYEIKSLRDRLNTREIYTILLIIAVGAGSFGLGRLSKLDEGKSPIRIEQSITAQTASALSSSPPQVRRGADLPAEAPARVQRAGGSAQAGGGVGGASSPSPVGGGQLVASKTGAKYHFPWCSGAQRISETNKVWFDSVEEARKAGYTPASNCKGLK